MKCLAAVGTWAMLSYKTGRVQNSVNNDMNFLNATVYNDLAPDLKAKADYLHKVCVEKREGENKHFLCRHIIAAVLVVRMIYVLMNTDNRKVVVLSKVNHKRRRYF